MATEDRVNMRIASDTGYRRPRHRSADARSPELPALLLITLMCFASPTSAGTPVPDPRMVVTDGYVSAIATWEAPSKGRAPVRHS